LKVKPLKNHWDDKAIAAIIATAVKKGVHNQAHLMLISQLGRQKRLEPRRLMLS
jgi:hypothetical protein